MVAIPEVSTLHVVADDVPCTQSPDVQPLQFSNQFEALTDDDLATILCDFPSVQLSTYDCSRASFCFRVKGQFEADVKLLYDQLPVGQQLNHLVQEMHLCETAVSNYALTLVLAQPPGNSSLSLETGVVSEVRDNCQRARPASRKVRTHVY